MSAAAAHKLGQWLAIIACVVGAAYIMSTGRDGWGWLLFLAILLA